MDLSLLTRKSDTEWWVDPLKKQLADELAIRGHS